jgi:four helix bundle protein
MKEGALQVKSYAFASRIVKAYKYLATEQKEFVLSKQLLRSGTSIGANVEEAIAGSSRADFANKLAIAAKEARETRYWLRLLHDNAYLPESVFTSLHEQCLELIRMLNSSLLTTKGNKPTT